MVLILESRDNFGSGIQSSTVEPFKKNHLSLFEFVFRIWKSVIWEFPIIWTIDTEGCTAHTSVMHTCITRFIL